MNKNDVQVIVDEMSAYIALGDLDALRDALAELCDLIGVCA